MWHLSLHEWVSSSLGGMVLLAAVVVVLSVRLLLRYSRVRTTALPWRCQSWTRLTKREQQQQDQELAATTNEIVGDLRGAVVVVGLLIQRYLVRERKATQQHGHSSTGAVEKGASRVALLR